MDINDISLFIHSSVVTEKRIFINVKFKCAELSTNQIIEIVIFRYLLKYILVEKKHSEILNIPNSCSYRNKIEYFNDFKLNH